MQPLNSENSLDRKFVIPAQAGIQLIKKIPRSGSTLRFCPLRGLFISLDSRLRGNDGSNELSGKLLGKLFGLIMHPTPISAIALDLGTTSIKAGLLDQHGTLRDVVSHPAAPITGSDGRYESDALKYANIAERVLSECLARIEQAGEPLALGLCSQRSSFLIWDKASGQPITPLISWQDNRGAASCAALQDSNNFIHARTGLRLTPYYFAPKLHSMLDDKLCAQIVRGELLLGTLDTFLIWRWTRGTHYITDASMAARTLLMDIKTQQWSPALGDLFGIPVQCLPRIQPSAGLNLNLNNGYILQASVADQSAALIATLAHDGADALINLGTGGFVIRYLPARAAENILPKKGGGYLTTLVYQDKNLHAYTACEGTLNSIAAALAPYPVNECTPENLAQNSGAGEEIFCLAEPSGIGAPYFRADIGLTFSQPTTHLTQQQIATLLLEAIIFRVAHIVEEFHQQAPLQRVYLSGGLSQVKCLQQGIAQCLPCEVYVLAQPETSLHGAALLASGLSLLNVNQSKKIQPHPDANKLREKFQRWKIWLDELLK